MFFSLLRVPRVFNFVSRQSGWQLPDRGGIDRQHLQVRYTHHWLSVWKRRNCRFFRDNSSTHLVVLTYGLALSYNQPENSTKAANTKPFTQFIK
jgi:hypothetical protein